MGSCSTTTLKSPGIRRAGQNAHPNATDSIGWAYWTLLRRLEISLVAAYSKAEAGFRELEMCLADLSMSFVLGLSSASFTSMVTSGTIPRS